MANRKVTEMAAHTAPATDDVLPIIDVSESAAANKNKKITVQELFKGVPDGTAAAPGLAFESDDGNGIYLAGTDTVGISTGGTERVTVNASGDVSISGSLTVAGTTTTIESTTVTVDDKNIELGSVATPTDATADGGGITLKGATDKTINWVNSTGYWTFNTGVEVGGNIDLADSNKLLLGDDDDAEIYFNGTNTIIDSTAGNVELHQNGTKRLEATSTGATVTGDLQVSGGQLQVTNGGLFENQTSSIQDLVVGTMVNGTGGADLVIRKARGGESGPAQINAGDQLGEFKIKGYNGSDYQGAFKIVCTSTTNTNYFAPNTDFYNNNVSLFTLNSGDGTQFHKQIFSNDNISQGSNGFQLFAGNGTHKLARSATSGVVLQVYGYHGSFLIRADGDAENTNNRYTGISDSKLKENIVDANSQWDDIKAVQVRNYNFKAETNFPTHTQIGVVAQELETVCPGLVQENPDLDANDNDLGTTTKSVAYSVLYMKAVKALQEAMTRIETLEAKVAALEAAN